MSSAQHFHTFRRPPSIDPVTRNLGLLCAFHAVHLCVFPVAVFSLFLRDDLGLSPSTILVTQAAFALAVALLEFPSGYLADRLGYRRALVLGSGIVVGGWCFYSWANDLASVLIGEGILGIGYALLSGADVALLYDTLKHANRTHEAVRWLARRRFIGQTAEAFSAAVAGVLYASWARLPIVAEAFVWLPACFIAWRLRDVRVATKVTNHLDKAREVVVHALLRSGALRALGLVFVLVSLGTYVPIWLISLHATDLGVAVGWVGPLWALAALVVGAASLFSERCLRRFGLVATLAVCAAVLSVGYFGLAFVPGWSGLAFYFCFPIARGLASTVLEAEEQARVPSGDRASFVSLRSLAFRSSFVIVGPVVGLGVDAFGIGGVWRWWGLVIAASSVAALVWLVVELTRERALVVAD